MLRHHPWRLRPSEGNVCRRIIPDQAADPHSWGFASSIAASAENRAPWAQDSSRSPHDLANTSGRSSFCQFSSTSRGCRLRVLRLPVPVRRRRCPGMSQESDFVSSLRLHRPSNRHEYGYVYPLGSPVYTRVGAQFARCEAESSDRYWFPCRKDTDRSLWVSAR